MTAPTVRAATAADLPALAALEEVLFGADAWSETALGEELEAAGREVVVHDDGAVIGYAVTVAAGEVVDLARIGVRPDRQREGIAGELLAHLLAQTPADRMLLEVSSRNRAALGFYADHGFTRIDVRPRYYRDRSDAVVMRRALTGGDAS